jgi:hypothetical protein
MLLNRHRSTPATRLDHPFSAGPAWLIRIVRMELYEVSKETEIIRERLDALRGSL